MNTLLVILVMFTFCSHKFVLHLPACSHLYVVVLFSAMVSNQTWRDTESNFAIENNLECYEHRK